MFNFNPGLNLQAIRDRRLRLPLIQLLGMLVGMGISLPILAVLFLVVSPTLLSEESPDPPLAKLQNKIKKPTALNFVPSPVLKQIATESGLSDRAKITVCTLKRDCWHLRGDEPPTSPASLAKVPIAVALMHKVVTEKIDLEIPIAVTPGNFTEDASEIQTEESYPLWKLLAEMLVHSSNIAPNQLIDYLGRDYINQVLQENGYQVTRVHAKFTGDRIVPAEVGTEQNTLTSNELATMMVRIYQRNHPRDNVLIALLKYQRDRELGYKALEKSTAKWLGEKTGQNSKVIGTTLAVEIAGKTYTLAVIDDGEYSDVAIRDAISKISDRLINKKGL